MSVAQQHLELRLENSAVAFFTTSTALVARVALLKRDTQGIITPATAAKTNHLIFHAQDTGRYGITPFRNVRLTLTHRANIRVAAGAPAALAVEYALIEHLMDSSNLTTSLNAPSLGVAVKCATRRPGHGHRLIEDIREQVYEIECKCVAMENTTTGLAP
jgi:hypothetical protein